MVRLPIARAFACKELLMPMSRSIASLGGTRWVVAALVLATGIALASCSGARPTAPWCAALNGGGSIIEDCAYFSFEQCMQTVRGVGGYCHRNAYAPPERPGTRRPLTR